MVPYRNAPWKDPQKRDSSGRLAAREKPEFFTRYLRLNKPDRGPAASLTGAGAATSNYEQCEANPGVARDKITNKYRLLMIADGQAKPFGRFHVEQEGIEGYSAYTDMQTKGPLGIMGVPGSIGNIAAPGVALLSKRAWHVNRRNRPNIDEGNYDEYAEKENILAAQRFSQQRLGNDFARLERDLADDVANARGVHKQVAALRQSFAGFGSPSDPIKDSLHLDTQASIVKGSIGVYDNRGLTLATSAKGAATARSYTGGDVRKSLAFTMAHPNKPISFRNVPFRPATSLLRDKGQWTGRAPDHTKLQPRVDMLAKA